MKCDRRWWMDGWLEREQRAWAKLISFRYCYIHDLTHVGLIFGLLDRILPRTEQVIPEFLVPRPPPDRATVEASEALDRVQARAFYEWAYGTRKTNGESVS